MRHPLPTAGAVLCALALAAGALAQGAAPAEPPPPVQPNDVLSAEFLQSADHRVLTEVEVRGNTLAFALESSFGRLEAPSLALLEERIHELRVLGQATTQLERDDRPFGANLRGQLRVSGESFGDILGSPIDTAGALAGQLGSNIGQTLVEINTVSGPDDAPDERAAAAPDAQRRTVAANLGLDPYSSNPKVQQFLALMASRRAGGGVGRSVATLSVPRVDRAGVDGGLLERRLSSDLKNLEPEELEYRNDAHLRDMGVDERTRRRFLASRALTPRHQSAIVEYLRSLGPVPGRERLVAAAAEAGDETEALAFEQLARMLAVYHQRVAALRELGGAGTLPMAVDARGAQVVALPADLLYWSADARETFARLARTEPARGRELVVSGILSPRAREALAELGFRTHERFLVRP